MEEQGRDHWDAYVYVSCALPFFAPVVGGIVYAITGKPFIALYSGAVVGMFHAALANILDPWFEGDEEPNKIPDNPPRISCYQHFMEVTDPFFDQKVKEKCLFSNGGIESMFFSNEPLIA